MRVKSHKTVDRGDFAGYDQGGQSYRDEILLWSQIRRGQKRACLPLRRTLYNWVRLLACEPVLLYRRHLGTG